jgi:hypothetical protein
VVIDGAHTIGVRSYTLSLYNTLGEQISRAEFVPEGPAYFAALNRQHDQGPGLVLLPNGTNEPSSSADLVGQAFQSSQLCQVRVVFSANLEERDKVVAELRRY